MLQNILIMILFIIFGRNVPKGIAIPNKKIILRYIILLGLFFLVMGLTNNH
jgi:CBS domain containing-hemolysin-like protein